MRRFIGLIAVLVLHMSSALSHDLHQEQAKPQPPAPSTCIDPVPACARTATPAFGPDGRLWLIYAVGGQYHVAASSDLGRNFAPAAAIPDRAEALDDNGEARPALLATREGTLVAMFGHRVDKSYNGKLFVTRSTDGGAIFSTPQPLLDGIGQRFPALVQDPNGRIHASWLDIRNRVAAKSMGQSYHDTGVATAWSDDGGASFQGKTIRADLACDCCRVPMVLDGAGTPVLAWRHVFPGHLRDHVVASAPAGTAPLAFSRVSEDGWAVEACPRHGPSLSPLPDGALGLVWYTQGKARQGLVFARSADGGESWSTPQSFGDASRRPSHPQLLAANGRVWRAWKEFDGSKTSIVAQSSADGGANWSEARSILEARDASDHPILIGKDGKAYLSWLSKAEGYRLMELAP